MTAIASTRFNSARGLRSLSLLVVVALAATVVFANPVNAQNESDAELASADVFYTDVDQLVMVDLARNDAGPAEPTFVDEQPAILIIGMESGTLTLGIDGDSNESALYAPPPGFSGVDSGEYMICWATTCAGATVTIYVGTAACTISADSSSAAAGDDDDATMTMTTMTMTTMTMTTGTMTTGTMTTGTMTTMTMTTMTTTL